MQEVNIVTTVDGIGIIEAKNDLVSFALTTKAKSDSLEDARKQVAAKMIDIENELKTLGMKLENAMSSSIDNFKLEHREGNERYSAGYQSVGTISWTCAVDENLNKIYKTCRKIDPNMSYPLFSIKNREILSEQATIKASEDARFKLNRECELLNISPDSLKIYNWHFGYDGTLSSANKPLNHMYNNGVFGVTGATGPQGAIGVAGPMHQITSKVGSIYQELLDPRIEPGTVIVRIGVRINYIWNE